MKFWTCFLDFIHSSQLWLSLQLIIAVGCCFGLKTDFDLMLVGCLTYLVTLMITRILHQLLDLSELHACWPTSLKIRLPRLNSELDFQLVHCKVL